MAGALLTYEGYVLNGRQSGGYFSIIDGESLRFDSVAQWIQYVDFKTGKNEKKKRGNRS